LKTNSLIKKKPIINRYRMDIKHTTTLGGKGTLPKEEAYY